MIHEISGYSLCVVSPYEEPQIDSYRGADAQAVFVDKLQSLSDEMYKKIKMQMLIWYLLIMTRRT